MDNLIYLDYQSTTPCDSRVVKAMLPYFSQYFGNANSDHVLGQQANQAVEKARGQVASLLGVLSQEIIFTSGATEANNLAIQGVVKYLLKQKYTARRIITVCTEHKSVLEVFHSLIEWGIEVIMLPVDGQGIVDPEALREALQTPTLLVSIMAANNETSVVQPVSELAKITHEHGVLFHCDMVQAVGKIGALPLENIDLASFSGHKIYAPKGIGVLYVRRKPRARLSSLFYGGYQERGIRPGTLPVSLIVGMGEACEIIQKEGSQEAQRLLHYKNLLIDGLMRKVQQIKINGSLKKSLPGSINLCFPGAQALDLLNRIPHLCLSTGSACTVSSLMPSYVLLAMGLSREEALQSFRLSFGRMTTKAQVREVIDALSCAYHDIMAGR